MTSVPGQKQRGSDDKIALMFNLVLRYNCGGNVKKTSGKKMLQEYFAMPSLHIYSVLFLHVPKHSTYAAVFLLCSSP